MAAKAVHVAVGGGNAPIAHDDGNIPVQRRQCAVRWNRLLAGSFLTDPSEALEDDHV